MAQNPGGLRRRNPLPEFVAVRGAEDAAEGGGAETEQRNIEAGAAKLAVMHTENFDAAQAAANQFSCDSSARVR